MICENHGNRMAVINCNHCGKPMCEDCGVPIKDQVFCKSCVQEIVTAVPARARVEGREKKKFHSKFLTLLFSFILPPGGNYMYLGLMKRGIFTMLAFFFAIYCITLTESPMFAFVIPIIWIAALFDSLNIRRRMENGEAVIDSVDDIISFVRENKTPVILFALAAIVASAADGFMWYPFSHFMRPLIIIGFGVLLVKVFFKKNTAPAAERYDGDSQ